MSVRAPSSSACVGPFSRSKAISLSMAASRSSGFTPGRAVTSHSAIEVRVRELFSQFTVCAICCS